MSTLLTIAVANVQAGVGTTDDVFHYITTWWKYWLPHSDRPLQKTGEMMKREGVDLGFLIEVSGSSLQSGYRSQNDVVADSAELDKRKFFTTKEFRLFTHEGLGIISRHTITNPKIHPLQKGILSWFLAEGTIEIDGKKITLFLAHLALGPKVRAAQFRQIAEIVKNTSGPIILAGDFNETREEPFEMLLHETSLKHSCPARTFPSWKPKHSFDRILLTNDFTVIKQYIPQSETVSDHLPFVVHAELK